MHRSLTVAVAVVVLGAGCGEQPAPITQAPPAQVKLAATPPQPAQPVAVAVPAPQPVAVAKAPEAPKEDPNRVLAERVKRALEDEARVHAAAIDVTAAGGTVTLWGTAATHDERTRAARVASRIAGVKWVDNRLVIASGS